MPTLFTIISSLFGRTNGNPHPDVQDNGDDVHANHNPSDDGSSNNGGCGDGEGF